MNYLILVKHSLPKVIPTVSAAQWKLSKTGKVRCGPLSKKIECHFPDIIVSSVEPKAVETAQIIAQRTGNPTCIFEGLHEHDRTDVGFLRKDHFENKIEEFFKNPDNRVLGNETANQACERFSKALTSVESEYPQKNIVVVSHGTVITLYIQKTIGIEPFSFWKRMGLPSFVIFTLPHHQLLTIVESVV